MPAENLLGRAAAAAPRGRARRRRPRSRWARSAPTATSSTCGTWRPWCSAAVTGAAAAGTGCSTWAAAGRSPAGRRSSCSPTLPASPARSARRARADPVGRGRLDPRPTSAGPRTELGWQPTARPGELVKDIWTAGLLRGEVGPWRACRRAALAGADRDRALAAVVAGLRRRPSPADAPVALVGRCTAGTDASGRLLSARRPATGPASSRPAHRPAAPYRTSGAPAARCAGHRSPITGSYQLQGYPGGRLDELARAPAPARRRRPGPRRPAPTTSAPTRSRRYARTGKRVLAYFEIGSIEDFRPGVPALRADAPDLVANAWADWPEEYFVRYWDERLVGPGASGPGSTRR